MCRFILSSFLFGLVAVGPLSATDPVLYKHPAQRWGPWAATVSLLRAWPGAQTGSG
jgi:hypothetical protein